MDMVPTPADAGDMRAGVTEDLSPSAIPTPGPRFGVWETWRSVGYPYALHGSSATDVWAVGRIDASPGGGLVLHYDGSTWQRQPVSFPGSLLGVWARTPTDAWAVGFTATTAADGLSAIYRASILRWDGTTWTEVFTRDNTQLRGVWGSAADDVWFVGGDFSATPVGTSGIALHWDGRTISDVSTGSQFLIESVHGTARGDVWRVGNVPLKKGGPAYERTQHFDGTAWSDSPLRNEHYLYGVHAVSRTDVWAVSDTGVHHWDGAAWSKLGAQPTGRCFSRVWASGPSDVWVGGSDAPPCSIEQFKPGLLFHYDGTAWKQETQLQSSLFGFSIWGSSSTDIWALGDFIYHRKP